MNTAMIGWQAILVKRKYTETIGNGKNFQKSA